MENVQESNNEVVFIRMITGEDIIATIIDEDEAGGITVEKPLRVHYSVRPEFNNALTVSLYEWVFPGLTKSTSFLIKDKDIILVDDISDVFLKYYKQVLKRVEKEVNKVRIFDPDEETVADDELELIETALKKLANNEIDIPSKKKLLH